MLIWDRVHKNEKWGYNSPLIPLYDTNYFAPVKVSLTGNWIKKTDIKLGDILKNCKICTYQELGEHKEMFELNWLRYLQLKHFVDSLPHPIRLEGNLLPLERLCLAPSGGGGMSQIYKILLGLKNKGLPSYIKKWDEE